MLKGVLFLIWAFGGIVFSLVFVCLSRFNSKLKIFLERYFTAFVFLISAYYLVFILVMALFSH